VRELLNVLERAVVSTERGAPLRLPPSEPEIYVIPRGTPAFGAAVPALEGLPVASAEPDEIRSDLEMRRRERENLSRALAHCHGRIYGPDGAAALLGMKPTTLASRLKRLHLR
jgi:transcriptional regulator with GAF, ATPase, and Fis domain